MLIGIIIMYIYNDDDNGRWKKKLVGNKIEIIINIIIG